MKVVQADPQPDRLQRWIAFGNLLSVLFLAVGLFLTYQANEETSNANREQQRLTAEGQVTDRFTKAIEQLGQAGSDKIDVRLGAIYALERIMRDSAADQPAVVDVLAAFVRVHSPAPPPVLGTRSTTADEPLPRGPVDIQAALTVLGRRDVTHDGADPNELQLDLANTDLTRADLADARLAGVDLDSANLTQAYLGDANLTRAYLRRATLTKTALIRTNLTDAFLLRANLAGADLHSANLAGANLTEADLNGADLYGADLTGAYLNGADLTGADLYGATLAGADLTGANLTGAEDVTSDMVRCAQVDSKTVLPTGVTRPTPCG